MLKSSSPAVAIRSPFGLHATEKTTPACPARSTDQLRSPLMAAGRVTVACGAMAGFRHPETLNLDRGQPYRQSWRKQHRHTSPESDSSKAVMSFFVNCYGW